MSTVHAPAPAPAPTARHPLAPPPVSRQVGYALAVGINAGLLWVVHQLLAWEWPGFLTEDFSLLLPLVTASFVASIVTNAAFIRLDRGRFRGLADLATSAIGVVVSVRTWQVFPFDFTGYANDWSWLVHLVLAAAILGSAVGAVIALVKLVGGESATAAGGST